jgi:hypothetical protein
LTMVKLNITPWLAMMPKVWINISTNENSRFKGGKLAAKQTTIHSMRVILEVKSNVCLLILPTFENIKLCMKVLKIRFERHYYRLKFVAGLLNYKVRKL